MSKLNVQIEANISGNKTIYNVIDCIGYWNTNGMRVYNANIAGEMGSKRSQEEARKVDYNTWLLNCILYDIQTLIKEYNTFICGKGGSHVWLSNNENQRLLFITVQ